MELGWLFRTEVVEKQLFGDRIKLIGGPWGQSRVSGFQSGKLEARDVRGPDK